jgi:hypothetical protein
MIARAILLLILVVTWEHALPQARDEAAALNVTIGIFDPGVPADDSVLRELEVFPRIRAIEARLLPFRLRQVLVDSGEWGAVRVVSQADDAAELRLLGTIIRSDGDLLELRIRAVDATGREWFDAAFSGRARETRPDAGEDDTESEFRQLYRAIAAEMEKARDELDTGALKTVQNVSLMRYAAELAPSAFTEFIEQGEDGRWSLSRLPATNDPMLRRIERIRSTEFLITDTVDAKFRELNDEVARTYRVWRDYRRKYVGYQEENVRFAAKNLGDAPRGSWEAIKDQYDAYKYDRVTVQEQDRLAVAFDNEVRPVVKAMEERVAELEGWVEQGYSEWHRLLEELDEVETYLGQ